MDLPPIPPEPKKREPSAVSAAPLESDILRQIVDGLRMHPLVGLVERINSGSAVEKNSDGSSRYISFHHIYPNQGGRMRAVDLSATLRNGKRFVLEIKRPPWTKPRNEREVEQLNYINHIKKCGGYGIVATGWDDVSKELDRIRGD